MKIREKREDWQFAGVTQELSEKIKGEKLYGMNK